MIRTARSDELVYLGKLVPRLQGQIDLNVDRPIEGHLVPHVDIRHDREGHGKDVVTEVVMLGAVCVAFQSRLCIQKLRPRHENGNQEEFQDFHVVIGFCVFFVKGLFRSQ
ncbi:MAG: hypothetical protein IT284_00680 [Bacteroidetes bacterium]|nr:hypothetical protein [Bacteroidota bacterium]